MGKYEIPAILFSFFDKDSNRYKTVSTVPITFEVKEEQKINPAATKKKANLIAVNKTASRIAGGIVIGLVLIVLVYWLLVKKTTKEEVVIEKPVIYYADEILKTAGEAIAGSAFYNELYNSVWSYLSTRFQLEGSSVSKKGLFITMKTSGIAEDVISKLENILNQCEASQYTNAYFSDDCKIILQDAKDVIEAIEKNYSEYL
jgi:hypothetical protein